MSILYKLRVQEEENICSNHTDYKWRKWGPRKVRNHAQSHTATK